MSKKLSNMECYYDTGGFQVGQWENLICIICPFKAFLAMKVNFRQLFDPTAMWDLSFWKKGCLFWMLRLWKYEIILSHTWIRAIYYVRHVFAFTSTKYVIQILKISFTCLSMYITIVMCVCLRDCLTVTKELASSAEFLGFGPL